MFPTSTSRVKITHSTTNLKKKKKLTLEASKSIYSHLVVMHLNQALGICIDLKLTYENDKHDERMID